jgi:hypothetical protein
VRNVRNGWLGQFRLAPTPLEICPGRAIWEKHANSEYLIFVDESFYNFFGFADIEGNFCHAALGLPKCNCAALQKAMRPSLEAYKSRIGALTGEPPRELKSTSLARLPLDFRIRFTRELVSALIATGGFVAGFYSTTRGIVMERVRTNLLDEMDRVPEEHSALYDAARIELLTEFKGVGQSRLIKQLLLHPFSALSNLLASFDCTFRIRYDPRDQREDQEVRAAMGQYMQGLARVPELFDDHNPFLGMDIHIASHEDVGLQLVDIVAGEVRGFFRRNPEALSENATLTLITTDSDEPLQYFLKFNQSIHKVGALSPMSSPLAAKLGLENSDNLISYYYPVLAAGIVSCVSDTGQPRLLEIPTGLILDQQE